MRGNVLLLLVAPALGLTCGQAGLSQAGLRLVDAARARRNAPAIRACAGVALIAACVRGLFEAYCDDAARFEVVDPPSPPSSAAPLTISRAVGVGLWRFAKNLKRFMLAALAVGVLTVPEGEAAGRQRFPKRKRRRRRGTGCGTRGVRAGAGRDACGF